MNPMHRLQADWDNAVALAPNDPPLSARPTWRAAIGGALLMAITLGALVANAIAFHP